MLLERQARRSGLAITSTIVKAATDLLLRAQGLQGKEQKQSFFFYFFFYFIKDAWSDLSE